MVDFEGKELNVGDEVIFLVVKYGSNLYHGKITNIYSNDEICSVFMTEKNKEIRNVYYDRIYKIVKEKQL